MPVVGIVLSGCGVFDGSEIHEAVLTLYFLRKAGADVLFMAPDRDQLHVINHLKGEVVQGTTRNILEESARIARGEIQDIREVHEDQMDALIFPGGFGAAKNLCDFALNGDECTVDDEVERLVKEIQNAGKPVGLICIAPTLMARILGEDGAELTIGSDKDTAEAIEKMGSTHVSCPVDDFVVDEEKKIVTTPAYMLADDITEAAAGIEKLVSRILSMI
jgi:enhancing lycopene biosynthesis protein 2